MKLSNLTSIALVVFASASNVACTQDNDTPTPSGVVTIVPTASAPPAPSASAPSDTGVPSNNDAAPTTDSGTNETATDSGATDTGSADTGTADSGSTDAADAATDTAPTVTPGTATISTANTLPTQIVLSGRDAWVPFAEYKLCADSTEDMAFVGTGVALGSYGGYKASPSDFASVGILWNGMIVGSSASFPGNVWMDFTSGIVAARGTCTTFQVVAKIAQNAQSGHGPSLGIYGDSSSTKLAANVVGMESGQHVTVPFGTAYLGLPMVVRKCAPVVTHQYLSTGLANGDQDSYKFGIGTMGSCTASVMQITFNVTKTASLSLTNFRLRRGAADLDPSSYTIFAFDESPLGLPDGVNGASVAIMFKDEQVITGSGFVYTLHQTVSGATTGSFLEINTTGTVTPPMFTGKLTQRAPTGYLITDGTKQWYSSFVWSDLSSITHNASLPLDPDAPVSSDDWIGEALVSDLTQAEVYRF